MTFLELQQLVSVWLDDVNNGYFTLPQIKLWLNNAQKETQKLLIDAGENWYLKCVETTLVAGQRDYIVPEDFLKVHRLETIISGTAPNECTQMLQPITLNQQNYFQTTQGDPYAYFIKKNRFSLWPAPQNPITLRLFYSYRVADMVLDAEVPDVPPQYHEFLAILATLDGFHRDDRNPSQFLEKRAYYEAMLKMDADERNVDVPRSIVVTDDPGLGVYL